jgi:hypothetical protein
MDKEFFGFMYFIKQLGFINRNSENTYANTLWRSKSKEDVNGWELIKDEFYIKFKKKYIRKDSISNIISATDLANYIFCPASFVISKSFTTLPTDKMKTGTSFHERNTILKRLNLVTGDKPDKHKLRQFDYSDSKDFWNDISTSTSTYLGHSVGADKQYFYDLKRIFIGQPDYIFLNNNGKNFVVEEKFLFKEYGANANTTLFHYNHKIQLASYVHGISNPSISYGYLVYWIYGPKYQYGYRSSYIDRNDPYEISNVHIMKINNSDSWKSQLNQIFFNIKKLKETGSEKFDINNLNINKCINCSVSMHCSHKTGRFDELDIMYPDRYFELQKSSIPKQRLLPDVDLPY